MCRSVDVSMCRCVDLSYCQSVDLLICRTVDLSTSDLSDHLVLNLKEVKKVGWEEIKNKTFSTFGLVFDEKATESGPVATPKAPSTR